MSPPHARPAPRVGEGPNVTWEGPKRPKFGGASGQGDAQQPPDREGDARGRADRQLAQPGVERGLAGDERDQRPDTE